MAKIEVRLNPDVTPAGSDLSIVNAARRSFNNRSEWGHSNEWSKATGDGRVLKDSDKRLLHFLARGMTADDFERFTQDFSREDEYKWDEWGKVDLYKMLWKWRNTPTHDTPFNHTFISFEIKAPIFVARQLVKHEYLIMSEFSRRYITDDIEFYEPDYWRKAAPNKKQGSLEEPVDLPEHVFEELYEGNFGDLEGIMWTMEDFNHAIEALFRNLVGAEVAPEQARMVLPQSTMTEWTWSGTLGAFAKMCRERLHPDAQYETRIVAQGVYDILKEYYPVAAPALVEGC
jgi:thymidylate synthase (FAD)